MDFDGETRASGLSEKSRAPSRAPKDAYAAAPYGFEQVIQNIAGLEGSRDVGRRGNERGRIADRGWVDGRLGEEVERVHDRRRTRSVS